MDDNAKATLDWAASSAEWGQLKESTDIGLLKHFAKHAHSYHAELAQHRVQLLEADVARREQERAKAEAHAKAEAEAQRQREKEAARRRADAERLAPRGSGEGPS